ncbi:MAG: hypothetical protein GY811_06745 [Myxococcales bacterium]|nr:hypothetical protein [Myxococcales bacterium]
MPGNDEVGKDGAARINRSTNNSQECTAIANSVSSEEPCEGHVRKKCKSTASLNAPDLC